MKQELYLIKSDGSIFLQSFEEVSADWVKDDLRRWLIIEDARPEEIDNALEPFELNSVIVEALTEEYSAPRVSHFGDAVLISIPIFLKDSHGNSEYITLLSLPTTLITLTGGSNLVLHRLTDELTTSGCLVEPTVQALIYSIFDVFRDLSVEPYFQCRREIAQLSRRLEEELDKVDLGDILAIRRIIDGLVTSVEDQLYCLNTFTNVGAKALADSLTLQYFRDMINILAITQRAFFRIESRVEGLHQHYLLSQQDTTNRRLKILTVLSAIYLPSTLIAGIYGMNFPDIPILGMPDGYYIVLAIMILLVIGQLGFFYWKRWF